MTDLRQKFLKQIEDEPGKALHKGVFADYLEQEGDEQAKLYRALYIIQSSLLKYGLGEKVITKKGNGTITALRISKNSKGVYSAVYEVTITGTKTRYSNNDRKVFVKPEDCTSSFSDFKHKYNEKDKVLIKDTLYEIQKKLPADQRTFQVNYLCKNIFTDKVAAFGENEITKLWTEDIKA